jgi:hypothetical protein
MSLQNLQSKQPQQDRKKKVDYRKFARDHFKDHAKALPMIYGTGYLTPKYKTVKPVVHKREKLYRIEFICSCGHSDIYRGGIKKTLNYIQKKTIPSCLRCSNYMTVKGIKENIFIVLYIYVLCLLKILKKN